MRRTITAWRRTLNRGAVAGVMSRPALEIVLADAQHDLTALHHVADIASHLLQAYEAETDSPAFAGLIDRYAPGANPFCPTTRLAISQQVRKTLAEAVKAAAP